MNPNGGRDAATLSTGATGAWTDLAPRAHIVQLYDADAFLLDELSRFLGAALGAGDAALVLATEMHRAGLAARLRARGLDLARAEAAGRYIALDAMETLARCLRDGVPDATLFAAVVGTAVARATEAAGGARVAVFGELVALLSAEGKHDAALRIEELWNDLARTYAFNLRCAYPLHAFGQTEDGAVLGRICAAHSHVIPAESFAALRSDQERDRAVALLQQKARALATEIEWRKRVQRALERREADLADVLENALEGVQQVGPDQVIRWANAALLTLLGYRPDEYVGHRVGEFHADVASFEIFWKKLMRREDIYDYPAVLRCNDGTVKHVLIHSNGLWDGDRFVHTRCFIRDVTEQVRMAQALRERNQALREAIAARDAFLSVAAHELKTPLTSLRAFTQLLLRDGRRERGIRPERLATALSAIEAQTAKLNRLVVRLLDTSQIAGGTLRIQREHTDLAALVRGAVASLDVDPAHPIAVEAPERLEASVDPVRFEQVVANLLDNALKFSPDGGTIAVALRQDGGGQIALSVTDGGTGIPPDQREAVFEQFHQAHGHRHLSGMGLGLFISRQIVELHGGRIWIEEPARGGARVVVTLPSAVSAPAEAAS